MNRLDKVALAAAIVTTVFFARGTFFIAQFYIDYRSIPAMTLPIGIAGWLIATYGPLATAVWFWRWAKAHHSPGVVHLLFLPCAVSLLWAGERLMLFAIDQPDFDAMLGGPANQAALLFVIAAGAYFAALMSRRISTSSNQA